MAAAPVALAHLGHPLRGLSHKRIHQGALAHTARAQQRHRLAAAHQFAQRSDALTAHAAGAQHGHPRGHRFERGDGCCRVVDQIAFGQHDRWRGAAVEGQHQFALEPPLIGWRGECVHQHHHIDVRRDGVRHRPAALERCPAGEPAVARHDVLDTFAVVADDHPVAHRHVGADVAHPHRLAVGLVQHRAPSPVEPSHPPAVATRGHRRQGLVEAAVPPESRIAARLLRCHCGITRSSGRPARSRDR